MPSFSSACDSQKATRDKDSSYSEYAMVAYRIKPIGAGSVSDGNGNVAYASGSAPSRKLDVSAGGINVGERKRCLASESVGSVRVGEQTARRRGQGDGDGARLPKRTITIHYCLVTSPQKKFLSLRRRASLHYREGSARSSSDPTRNLFSLAICRWGDCARDGGRLRRLR